MYAIVLLSIVASAAANVYVSSSCPTVKPVDDFNISAFGTGTWFELGRYSNTAEDGANCGRAEYSLTSAGFDLKNYHVVGGKEREIDGSAKLAADAGKTGKLIFSYPYGADKAITENTLWVLGTDYDNYAVVYHCKEDAEKKTRQDFNWVFSRTKKLEGAAKTAVDKIYADNTFLDKSKLIKPDFSDAACKVEA